MPGAKSHKLRAAVIETLENRQLLSLSFMPTFGVSQPMSAMLSLSSTSSCRAPDRGPGHASSSRHAPMIRKAGPDAARPRAGRPARILVVTPIYPTADRPEERRSGKPD